MAAAAVAPSPVAPSAVDAQSPSANLALPAQVPRRLTDDGRLKRDPTFVSADELVFGVDEKEDLIRLVRLNLASGIAAPLHPDAATSEMEPAFSRDGQVYAYTKNIGNLSVKLVIRNLRENRTAEIRPQGRGGMRSPVISPDGRRVVYCYAETGPQQIFSVNLDAGDKRTLTKSSGIDNWPGFDPAGQHLVFASSRSGDFEIYRKNLDDSDAAPRRLTHSPRQDIRPRVSPDGRRIVFVSSRDGNREIYLMNVDGTGVTRVTRNSERDDYPCWSPDGRQLVFVGERRGRSDLYLVGVPPAKPGSETD